jgi:predicted SAM-dependent methyltransferase
VKLKKVHLTEEQLEDSTIWKLNLACGRRIYPGKSWYNLDLVDNPATIRCDIWDLDWPVGKNCIDYVLASHILEHVPQFHPRYGSNFWYHFFPYLLSRLSDEAILEVWGPDPDRRDTLQYVGHTRLVGPKSFNEYTQPHTNFSSLENLDSRQGYTMELLLLEKRKSIHLGPVDDYHFEHYLGSRWRDRFARVLGKRDELHMVYRVRRTSP